MSKWIKEEGEQINHPAHYGGDTPYECIKVAKAWLTKEEFEGAMVFNVLKYLCRWRQKGGISSVKKAIFYLQSLVRVLEEDEGDAKLLAEDTA